MANLFNKKRVSWRNLGFCRHPNRFRRKKKSLAGKRYSDSANSDEENSEYVSYQSLSNISSRSNVQNHPSPDKNLNESVSHLSIKREENNSVNILANENKNFLMESFLEYARNGNLAKVEEIVKQASNGFEFRNFNINYRGMP